MNFQAISETYRKTDKSAVNEHSSDYEIVAKIFDELIRSMNIYVGEVAKKDHMKGFAWSLSRFYGRAQKMLKLFSHSSKSALIR